MIREFNSSGGTVKSDGGPTDLTVIYERRLDSCTKQTAESYDGAWFKYEGYCALAKDEEELPNLELLVQTLHDLEGVSEVEIRMTGRVSAISQEDVDKAISELIFPGQFVLLEGNLHKRAEEWVTELNYAVKNVQGLVAIARDKEDLPEDNLMFALYAAYLNIPLEEFAILTKKDD